MTPSVFLGLALACAPHVDPTTATAIARVESSLNPWAIGVVRGRLDRQPASRREAIRTAEALQRQSWNFSVGLAQINVRNLERMRIGLDEAFEPCTNLSAMARILGNCYAAASRRHAEQLALRLALSCYYAGNPQAGFRDGYVRKVVAMASRLLPNPPARLRAAKELP